jgi:hypothetical protein
MTIWYIFSVLVSRTKKNLATLLRPISKNGLEGLSPEEDLRENWNNERNSIQSGIKIFALQILMVGSVQENFSNTCPAVDAMIFRQKRSRKNYFFLHKILCNSWYKNWIITLVFKKNAEFFVENWRISPKHCPMFSVYTYGISIYLLPHVAERSLNLNLVNYL